MKMSDISDILLSFKGMMPESIRATMAHKFLHKMGYYLQNHKEDDILDKWIKGGSPRKFLDDCKLDSPQASVTHDIAIHDTDLSNFCNRWMAVEKIRRPGEDYIPLTADMNSIRVTIIKELEALATAQKEMNQHDGNKDQI